MKKETKEDYDTLLVKANRLLVAMREMRDAEKDWWDYLGAPQVQKIALYEEAINGLRGLIEEAKDERAALVVREGQASEVGNG